MTIAIAADHAGLPLKQELVARLQSAGRTVADLGAHQLDPNDDYPDFAVAVAKAILEGRAERGILVCGSGVGVTIAANKFRGIRACLCHDTYSAHQGVEHDNMNVLVMGSRVIGPALAWDLVNAFLNAEFSGEDRHVRRLAKVQALET
ncbi:MAG: ribose 5-phosphate isomerase B [Bryobacteraceae bacterium]|nr:ribose 5-phosphate isomerase B [Bryobacteraceae bacterium]